MFAICASVSVIFKGISNRGTSTLSRKAIEVGGVGTGVYSFLVVTPMHDLMVSIGLLFALLALFATLQLLYATRRFWLALMRSVCTLRLLLSAAMYYGNVL